MFFLKTTKKPASLTSQFRTANSTNFTCFSREFTGQAKHMLFSYNSFITYLNNKLFSYLIFNMEYLLTNTPKLYNVLSDVKIIIATAVIQLRFTLQDSSVIYFFQKTNQVPHLETKPLFNHSVARV